MLQKYYKNIKIILNLTKNYVKVLPKVEKCWKIYYNSNRYYRKKASE